MNTLQFEYKIIGQGQTTLLIEIGIGNSFYDWYPLINEIKNDFTVIIYHRLGYGKSDYPLTARTTRNIAIELNSLIKRIGIKEKYILMGHSFGGLCVQQYAKMYPNEIEAIVLLDSTSYNLKQLEDLDTPSISSRCSINEMVAFCNNLSRKSEKELITQNKDMVFKYRKYVNADELQNVEDFFGNPKLYKTISDEFSNWIKDGEDIKRINDFPNIPLRVITRDKALSIDNWTKNNIPIEEATKYEDKWFQLQEELALLSNQSKIIVASGSDHRIYIDRPKVVIACLKSLNFFLTSKKSK